MSFPAGKLRAILAEHRVTRKQFATVCDLSPSHLTHVLMESHHPGELAQIKIVRGLRALSLPIPAELQEGGEA